MKHYQYQKDDTESIFTKVIAAGIGIIILNALFNNSKDGDITRIPNNVLDTWSRPDDREAYVDAHETIREVIGDHSFSNGLNKGDLQIFLQGSYKNSTTVAGDSDVDVVVMYTKSFSKDLTNLNTEEKSKFQADYPTSSYSCQSFRNDIIKALESHRAVNVIECGKKCVQIETNQFKADVIPCFQYRAYNKYMRPDSDGNYDEGIMFYNSSTNEVIQNFPKQHYENGTKKSELTNGNYKRAVRMFKNARNYVVDKKRINLHAPSYFVECMLYNVPSHHFTSSLTDTYFNVINYLQKLPDDRMRLMKCQNEITLLFGQSNTCWNITQARQLISLYSDLCNNW